MAIDWRKRTRRAARRHGLDPHIFERQIGVESGYADDVIYGRRRSSAGALGIAQIMPDTAKGWGVNPLDPDAALDAAAKNMAAYVKKYGGYENALRAYNAGPGAIEASRGYSETNNYVKKILGGRDPGGLASPRTASPQPRSGSTPDASGTVGSTVPDAPTGLDLPGGTADFTSLLSSLLSRPRPQPQQAMPVQAPQFSASPALPQGFTPLTPTPASPEPEEDRLSQALGLLETLRGPEATRGSDQPPGTAERPQTAPIFETVTKRRQERSFGGLRSLGKEALSLAAELGFEGHSGQRTDEQNAAVGGAKDSDHLMRDGRQAYDIPMTGEKNLQRVGSSLARRFGVKQTRPGWWEGTISAGKRKVRVQIIAGAQHNHGDHVHIGFRQL